MSHLSVRGEQSTSSEIIALEALTALAPSGSGQFIRKLTATTFENATPAGGGTVGPGTINELAYFDTADTVASLAVATYPSLTQLSYVKGVTSAIQTQLDAKVTGPASSTDNAIARFDSTTGKLLQNSTVTIGDTGGVATTIANTGNAVGLTVTQNDTTNNPRAVIITNVGTGIGLFVDQDGNGTALDIDSEATSARAMNVNVVRNLALFTTVTTGAANEKPFIIEGTGAMTSGDGLLFVRQTNASTTVPVTFLQNEGTGRGLVIDNNNNGIPLYVDKDVTNVNNTTTGITLDHTSVVNDAATYTKTGAALQINSNVTETSGTITDSAQVLDINQTHPDATGNVVDIANAGSGNGLFINQDGNGRSLFIDSESTTTDAVRIDGVGTGVANRDFVLVSAGALVGSGPTGATFLVYNNVATTTGFLASFSQDNASASGRVLQVYNDGTGNAFLVDNNNNGNSIEIDHDGNSASAITGLWVNTANAGAGGAYAAIFEAGRVGVITTTPTAYLHLGAGTATASTAPLKLTSGTLNTTAEAGAVEFLTDAYYGTITTGAARKTFAFLENVLPLAGGTMTGAITLGENASIALDPAGSADGKYTGITVTGTAGATLAFGDLIYLAVATSKWVLTDADAAATAGGVMIGMCVLAANDTESTTILLQGIIRADAKFPALTIGAAVYVGETAGAIQVSIPTGADNIIRVVGFAMTADEIYLNVSPDNQVTVA